MAADSSTNIGGIDNYHTLLAEYFSNMNLYVADPTGAALPPDFSLISDELNYVGLLTTAISSVTNGPSFSSGAAIENIHSMVAVDREYSMRIKGKTDYYTDAQTDYLNESNFYSTMKVFWMSMLSGIYSVGATS